jgi:hypothetical protein
LKETYNNFPCEPSCNPLLGAPIAVTSGANTTSGINFALDTGGGISGTVIDGATAAPISGVSIGVRNTSGTTMRTATTNASGVYAVTGLQTGNYLVRASTSANYVPLVYNNIVCLGCSSTAGTPVPVTAPATTGSINFTMSTGGQITGQINTQVGSAPIGNVLLNAYTSADVNTGRAAITSCTGAYTLNGLNTASFKVRSFTSSVHSRRYRAELFDNLDCAYTCSIAPGTLVSVTQGAATPNINQGLIRYVTVADFNASRSTDIGVYDPISGLWFIRNQFTLGYGGPGATIVPGDYDGDTYTDVAVYYYEGSGLWYVRRTTTGTDLVQGFGGPGYKAAPGDYDGDGKVDFAVFHAASGIWFIRQSSNGVVTTFGFGSSGATLVPADYDRDGKTDAAVCTSRPGCVTSGNPRPVSAPSARATAPRATSPSAATSTAMGNGTSRSTTMTRASGSSAVGARVPRRVSPSAPLVTHPFPGTTTATPGRTWASTTRRRVCGSAAALPVAAPPPRASGGQATSR